MKQCCSIKQNHSFKQKNITFFAFILISSQINKILGFSNIKGSISAAARIGIPVEFGIQQNKAALSSQLYLRGGAFHPSKRATNTFFSKSILAMTSQPSSSATTSTTERSLTPPVARRDDNHFIYAGNDPNTDFIRQSKDSPNPLVDPPTPIPSPYGWMRDESRTNEEVLSHLKSECDYTKDMTQHLDSFKDNLYEEMKGKLQETDYTVPVPRGEDYLYYSRTMEGKSYSIHCRAPVQNGSSRQQLDWDGRKEMPILEGEEVYLDTNVLAEGKDYCSTGNVRMSPSHTKVAYTLDTVGGETYKMFVKDVATNKSLYENIDLDIDSTIVWGNDDNTIYYQKMDDAHRPFQVYKKTFNSTEADLLVFEEVDELFWVHVSKSQDGKYLFISSESKETSEVRYISLSDDTSPTETNIQIVAQRRSKVLYDVEHYRNQFYIMSNVGGTPNMKLQSCPVQPECQDLWKDVVLDSSSEILFNGEYERSLDSVTPFSNHLVAQGREDGLPRIWILSLENNDGTNVDENEKMTTVKSFELLTFPEEAHDVGLGGNYNFETDNVLVNYDSLVTPMQTIQIPLNEPNTPQSRVVLKQKNVPGYNPDLYTCERTTVLSRDGKTEIPVSLVHRKDVIAKTTSRTPVPTHLYGYGSYGSCVEADFRMTRLPLLDRGVVYVIAHIRGGGEMGRQWYEEPNGAKYLCKKNTFFDFVDVAEWLVSDSGKGITTPEMLSCEGRSAGGLLIGASINLAPELFRVAILGVPFVDVACTMVDSTIPLTIVEWEEWGNPNEEKYKEYIMSYSPMENVKKGAVYPACLLTGGLHDPRVQYWEPSKFAAELRHNQSNESGPVCLKMDMTAGHFSASDRYKYLKELSFDYAFLLDQLGLV